MPDSSKLVVDSAAAVARVLGKSERSVNTWANGEGLPREQVGEKRYRYCIPDVVEWWVERSLSNDRKSRPPLVPLAASDEAMATDNDSDPLLVGADSPYLERYRKEKAIQARFETRKLRGELVDIRELHELLQPFFERVARSIEALADRFGEEASGIVERAINDAERAIKEAAEPEQLD